MIMYKYYDEMINYTIDHGQVAVNLKINTKYPIKSSIVNALDKGKFFKNALHYINSKEIIFINVIAI